MSVQRKTVPNLQIDDVGSLLPSTRHELKKDGIGQKLLIMKARNFSLRVDDESTELCNAMCNSVLQSAALIDSAAWG